MEETEAFRRLFLALAIGFIVGIERGWQTRELAEGTRVAGVRTFALIGLFGGILGVLQPVLGSVFVAIALVALTVLLVPAYRARVRRTDDFGFTTEVAALLTAGLGLLAVVGDMTLAAAGAAVMVALLSTKARLHGLLRQIERYELGAAIQLLLIAAVVLPLLPDRGYGPGSVLNPYALGWVVLLVAMISFSGHAAIRIAGTEIGILLTGFFGGIASSTALTVALARRARDAQKQAPIFAAGVAMATGTMFLRLLLILVFLNRTVAIALTPAFVATAAGAFAGALFFARRSKATSAPTAQFREPLDLATAAVFAVLLAVITVLVHFVREAAGDMGLYGMAALAALADVDALSVSMANAAGGEVEVDVAANAIIIAAFVNTAWKIGLGGLLGGWRFGLALAKFVVPALAIGGIALAVF